LIFSIALIAAIKIHHASEGPPT